MVIDHQGINAVLHLRSTHQDQRRSKPHCRLPPNEANAEYDQAIAATLSPLMPYQLFVVHACRTVCRSISAVINAPAVGSLRCEWIFRNERVYLTGCNHCPCIAIRDKTLHWTRSLMNMFSSALSTRHRICSISILPPCRVFRGSYLNVSRVLLRGYFFSSRKGVSRIT